MKTMPTRPTHEIRLGAIKAAIWKNETESSTRFTVKFCRIYKEGEVWKSTESFGRGDLLLLCKVVDLSHSWVHEQEKTTSRISQPPAEIIQTTPELMIGASPARKK